MTATVVEFNQNDTLIFEVLVKLVVLFFESCDFVVFHDILVGLEVVVVNVSLHEKVLNLKRVELFLRFYQFHGEDFLLLSDE